MEVLLHCARLPRYGLLFGALPDKEITDTRSLFLPIPYAYSHIPLPYFLPLCFRADDGVERAVMGDHVHRVSCHDGAASDLTLRLELP